jgi:uncharacterized protein YyaL (SSP411 family)
MENFDPAYLMRNNLDRSSSPYLLQHSENPVWWQEWSGDLVRHAAAINKPIFVSVGYATCHWCHVMAAEAFSDPATAGYLNNNFISIKIDREQRPDIDQFMMEFINRQNGRGGWPLNVFLTPSLRPVYALTYAPVRESEMSPSFLSIAGKVHDHIMTYGNSIPPFHTEDKAPSFIHENSLIRILSDYYDPDNGGFGYGPKFPPHSTLLYLLYQLGIEESPSIKTICVKTLDAMMLRGLNDHLQGGIFRYCVDHEWTIPHFEKMLYDQAMALWVYSLAFRVTGNEAYRRMAERIVKCLDETFDSGGLYISAHDADTDHKEGETYLWSYKELQEALDNEEFLLFTKAYHISEHGNFEGRNHLLRKRADINVDAIEDKLLEIRKRRNQPSPDGKILSGLNALAAMSMVYAGRYLNQPGLKKKAEDLTRKIIGEFSDGKSLSHSQYNGVLQNQSFLFDSAALLNAITLLNEDDRKWASQLDESVAFVRSFQQEGKWLESRTSDFPPVYASSFDHPIPSSVSLAEMGLARYALLKGEELETREYRQPFESDFFNLTAMIHNGLFHVFTSHELIGWDQLPVNSIQVMGEHEQDCYMGQCSPLQLNDIR